MATVETTTVTLTVNGREVTVAKGLSLVEAAAEAGVEIPVFCYEPRLGAGVNTFHDAFLDARRRIESGADPEEVVPILLRLAEADDEIGLAQGLYADDDDPDGEDG